MQKDIENLCKMWIKWHFDLSIILFEIVTLIFDIKQFDRINKSGLDLQVRSVENNKFEILNIEKNIEEQVRFEI